MAATPSADPFPPMADDPLDGMMLPDRSGVADLFRQTDWSATELGPVSGWSPALRTAVGICLNSRFPMGVRWGPSLVNVYNDAYVPILGLRHPVAFARPTREAWHDVWDVIGPQQQAVLGGEGPTWSERARLLLSRNGYPEEAYFTWSYSPIPDTGGGVGGVFFACTEETARVAAEAERDRLMLEVDAQRFHLSAAFEQSPAFLAILRGPEHTIETVNARYYALVGQRDVVGRPVAQALPEVVEQGFIDILDRVYRTGTPYLGERMKMLLQREPGQPLYESYLDFVYQPMRDGDGRITGILAHGVDRTDVAHTQARDRFLLEVEDAVRPLSDAEAIVATCAARLGEYLKADRCAYAAVADDEDTFDVTGDYTSPGMPSMVGRFRFSSFGEEVLSLMRANLPFVMEDLDAHDPPMANPGVFRDNRIISVICVPLHKNGRLAGAMALHQATARRWEPQDVELLQLVAARCWESIERVRVQRTLARSESQFRHLADAMPQIVFAADAEGHVDYFNQQWYDYTGLPDGDVGYESWHQVHTEDGLGRANVLWPEALRTGQPYEIEYALKRRDGMLRWHLGRALPIRDAEGNVVRWFGTNTDIHDRKRIEQQLQESEIRFRTMSDGAPVMIWMTRADGQCEYVNRQWTAFTGQRERDAWGDGWLARVHPEDRGKTGRQFMQSSQERKPFEIEYRVQRADGRYAWCVDAATPRFNPAGDFLGFIGSVVDITGRKRTEDSVASDKSVLELIATDSPLGDVLHAIVHGVEAQSADGMLCSISLADERGERLLHGAAPSLPPAYNAAMREMRIGEGVGSCGTSAARRETVCATDIANDPFWRESAAIALVSGLAACCSTPILAGDGRVLGTVAMYYRQPHTPSEHDFDLARSASHLAGIVIERHHTDLRLQQSLLAEQNARSDAERASRMKDEFLATLSHELRTPLNAILGWSRLIKGDKTRDKDRAQGLDVIERSARAQAQIIDDLLDMSAIISGKVRLTVAAYELDSLLQNAVDTALPTAQAKGVALELRLDDRELPTMQGDASRLQQVLWNLVSNAIKFTPAGGRVDVALELGDVHARVSVRDSGSGIEPAFLPYVFDRFRQADASASRNHGGLGLGLSIVKQLVELHGGVVRAESDGPGHGATFILLLPLRASAPVLDGTPAGLAPDAATPAEVDGGADLSGLRVLLVDDDQDSRDMAERLLRDAGASVTAAGSADAADAALAAGVFDVIVSDIGMPGRDGHALMRAVRGRGDRTPAVALTAYVRAEDRAKAVDAGFNAHLPKPLDAARLIGTVARLDPRRAAPARPIGA